MQTALLLPIGLALAIVGGCSVLDGPDDRVCTQVGCANGLTVQLDGTPPDAPWRVELLPTGESGARYVFDCPDARRCGNAAVFPDFLGDWAQVRVTTSRGTVTLGVRPTYVESRPNGPDCPPVCRNATVVVPLPG